MTVTRRLTMGQAVVEYLAQQYVERDGREWRFFEGVWGIFGHGNVSGMGQALEQAQERLRYYQARNEQAMVHVATAFAKRSNRLRAFACTTSIGPGATNMVTGAAVATVNRLPVLLLPGDIFATRQVAPVLQQLERPESQDVSVNDCFKPVSRYWDRINRPEQILTALPAALRTLTSPAETGAVTVALPQDVQTEAYEYPAGFFEKHVWRILRPRPDTSVLRQAADWIKSSERPLIICGGGVLYSEATAALDAFASQTGIPVAETQAGKGALRWDHAQLVGPLGPNGGLAGNRLARDADLVLVVGSRLQDFTTASKTAFQHPHVRFVSLNVAEMDAFKQDALPLVGDARAALEELAQALGEYQVSAQYRARVEALRGEWNAEVDRARELTNRPLLTQGEVIGVVNDVSGANATVVCAAGSLPGDLLKLWRTERPGNYHLEYGFSCMGYEIAGGLGTKLAAPETDVVVMVGDGSYLMMHTELLTAVQEGIQLTVVLLDNHGFNCIHNLAESCGERNGFNRFRFRDQQTGQLSGDFLPIDFVANAASLGANATRANSPNDLMRALEAAKDVKGPSVVVVDVDPENGVPGYESWWDVPVPEVSESETVRAARRGWEQHKAQERWFV